MSAELPWDEIPIRAVVFDLHSTLVHDGGDPGLWLDRALALLESEGAAQDEDLAELPGREELLAWAPRIWEHARELDPDSERDLGPEQHRRVFDSLVARLEVISPLLGDALYRTMFEVTVLYAETLPVLDALRAAGIRVAILSNVGIDSRPMLDRLGLRGHYDVLVLSSDEGMVKPDPRIFLRTVELLGVPPEETLMVGDSVEDDGGAAHVGMRTLILPHAPGPTHGLGAVLRLAGVGAGADAVAGDAAAGSVSAVLPT